MKIFSKLIAVIATFTIISSVFSIRVFSEELLNWEMSFGTTSQNAIAANDSLCVSVGTEGMIFITEDGLNWTKEKTVTDNELNDIVWSGKEFIAVGDGGLIISSTDGKNWVKKDSGTSIDLEGIICSSESVIVYGDGIVVISTDGVNWVKKEVGIHIESIVFNNGRFIALNSELEGITSTNGVDWTKYDSFPESLYISYGSITSFKGNFIITSSFGKGSKEIYVSKDGITWDTIEVSDLSYMIASEIVATENFLLLSGRYSAVAYTENITDWSLTKVEDMINSSDIDEILILDMLLFKGQYIAVMLGATTGSCFFINSKDFKTWQKVSIQQNSFILNSIATDGTNYITVGENGEAYKSSDGSDWTLCSLPSKDNLLSISWDGHQFVVLDEKGNIYVSEDGSSWSVASNISELYTSSDGSITDYGKLIYAQNAYFLLYDYPDTLIYTSKDLKMWDKIEGIDESVSDITSNGKLLVAVSYNTSIFTSQDAKNWTRRLENANTRFRKVIWSGNKFVAIGVDNKLAFSSDGIKWTASSTKDYQAINDICWDGRGYLAIDNEGRTIYSIDLINWVIKADNKELYDSLITWNGYRYISVGANAIRTTVPKDIIKVLVNGRTIAFDVSPVMSNNRTLVPARYIFEALKAEVLWEEASKKVTIKGEDKEVTLSINNTTAYVNNVAIELDAAPTIINGRTLIPLRFVAENFNSEVMWDKDTQTVSIKTSK